MRDGRRPGISETKSSQAIRLLPLSQRRQADTIAVHTHLLHQRKHRALGGHRGDTLPDWLPADPRPELSPNRKQDCLGNSTKNPSGEEAAATAERRGHEPVWLISGTVKSLGQATQHPLYIHLRLLPWEALILT